MRTVSNKSEKRILEVVLPAGTTGVWTVPSGVFEIQVRLCGGGGGASGFNTIFGGGGAGGFDGVLQVSPAQVFGYSVGVAGVNGANGSNSPGTNGGNTIFGSIFAEGGKTANASINAVGNGGKCGLANGGTGSSAATIQGNGFGGGAGSNMGGATNFSSCGNISYSSNAPANTCYPGLSIFSINSYGTGGHGSSPSASNTPIGGIIIIRYKGY